MIYVEKCFQLQIFSKKTICFSMFAMVLRTIVLDLLIGVILLEREVASTTTLFDFLKLNDDSFAPNETRG